MKKSEIISQLLSERNISHYLLNAKPENILRESEIIAQAGCLFSVTVATNMAGRGTDILLGGNPDFRARQAVRSCITFILPMIKEGYGIDFLFLLNFHFHPPLRVHAPVFKAIIKLLISEGITMNEVNEYLLLFSFSKIDLLEKILLNVVENGVQDSQEPIYKFVLLLYNFFYHQYKKICEVDKQFIKNLGGLAIIGTERHESQRIDNQLRGRSGRQGDPGCSKFILSLDDNLFRIFGGDKIKNMISQFNLTDDTPLEASFLTSALNSAQEKVEVFYYDTRKRIFDYDDIINKQRQTIFKERQTILNYDSVRTEMLLYGEDLIISLVRDLKLLTFKPDSSLEKKEFNQLNMEISYIIGVPYLMVSFEEVSNLNLDQLCCFFIAQFWLTYDLKEIEFEACSPGLIRLLEKSALLAQIDIAWKTHLQKMDILRDSIGWRSYGQLDPLLEYKNEAFNLFIDTTREIKYNAIYNVLKSRIV